MNQRQQKYADEIVRYIANIKSLLARLEVHVNAEHLNDQLGSVHLWLLLIRSRAEDRIWPLHEGKNEPFDFAEREREKRMMLERVGSAEREREKWIMRDRDRNVGRKRKAKRRDSV